MTYPIRPITPDEFRDFSRVWERAFNFDEKDEELEALEKIFEFDRSFVALDGDQFVGTGGAISFDLTVPGNTVGAAGLTAIAVAPTHRRLGILTDMMRYHFDEVRRRGQPVSVLRASESLIYGRYGYGIATDDGWFEIDGRHAALRDELIVPGRVDLVEPDEALRILPEVYAAAAGERPGFLSRTERDWAFLLADFDHWRDGMTSNRFAVYSEDDRPLGYLRYRVKGKWEDMHSAGELLAAELIAETPEAEAALWRYAFSVDLITTIKTHPRPKDELLSHLLVDPRRLRMRFGDGLWVRLLDVPAALSARRYATDGRLVIEVMDEFLPEVGGVFELSGGPDGAVCEPSDAVPDVTVDAAGLGARYLGDGSFEVLRRAGRATGGAEALRLADLMFGWKVAPWCPHYF